MTEFPLSPREKAMLRRLAKGWTTAEIRQSTGGTLDQVQVRIRCSKNQQRLRVG
jgi:DNA-binding CsgD family transcriptional regulator